MLDILEKEEQTVEVDDDHAYEIKEYLSLLDLLIEIDQLHFPDVSDAGKGRMMEDIVLLETKLANPDKQVFQLQFAVGEFDMVIHDPKALTCEIFEIKYSEKVVPEQYRHLVNSEKCAETEHRFGTITNKAVIYRGEKTVSDAIYYLNVEEYLKSLSNQL